MNAISNSRLVLQYGIVVANVVSVKVWYLDSCVLIYKVAASSIVFGMFLCTM